MKGTTEFSLDKEMQVSTTLLLTRAKRTSQHPKTTFVLTKSSLDLNSLANPSPEPKAIPVRAYLRTGAAVADSADATGSPNQHFSFLPP